VSKTDGRSAQGTMMLCVAICTRNRPQQLADCLHSLESSDLVDEVIVSTDGSDIETEMVALSAAGQFRHFSFLRGPRGGLAANRNNCIAAVRSAYVLFLDDDARLSAPFVEAALSAAGADRLVTGWELRAKGRVTPHDPDFLGFQRLAPNGTPKGIVINSTLFPTAFLRSRCFDDFYEFGSEEVDIAFGAAKRGLQIVEIDEGNVHLHVESSREGNDDAATASRVYFGVRRYRDYERSGLNLAVFLVLVLANALGFRIKRRQLTSLPATTCAFGRAAWEGWFIKDESLTVTPSSRIMGGRAPAEIGSPSLTVLIPTYRRPRELRRCLDAVLAQTRPPDQVIVIRRDHDEDTARVLSFENGVQEVVVSQGGTVGALCAGLSHASGDVVAVTDDDAVPRYDWLERLAAAFDDDSVGAVGGRDVVHQGGEIEDGRARVVGRMTWYGRSIGHHHLGTGGAREVDFLKGCNYAFRKEQFKIPTGLLGNGAQPCHDMASCLEVRRAGGRVLYDPRIVVDHYPGERYDEDGRFTPTRRARLNGTFNEAFSVFSLAPERRLPYLLYHVAIGDAASPGAARSLLGHIRRERAVTGRLLSTLAEVLRAYRLSADSPLQMWQPDRDPKTSFASTSDRRFHRQDETEWSA
jgi:glycosyltransferase involved in cell wall biosynthesis